LAAAAAAADEDNDKSLTMWSSCRGKRRRRRRNGKERKLTWGGYTIFSLSTYETNFVSSIILVSNSL
jgi:hypothetical protein